MGCGRNFGTDGHAPRTGNCHSDSRIVFQVAKYGDQSRDRARDRPQFSGRGGSMQLCNCEHPLRARSGNCNAAAIDSMRLHEGLCKSKSHRALLTLRVYL